MITCQTVTVTVSENDRTIASLVMPAYTRTMDDFMEVLSQHAAAYVHASRGAALSIGDFALYLVKQASNEPREQ